MTALAACIFVAGSLAGTLPAPDFTVEWTHSVQRTRWTERYRIERDALVLVEATVEGSGAGMEPGPDARFDGRAWRWSPQRRLAKLELRRSAFTDDYAICSEGRCTPMAQWAGPAGPDSIATIAPCPSR